MKKVIRVALVLAGLCAAASAQSIPETMSYQGLLADDQGQPLQGQRLLEFRIFEAESGGIALWQETHAGVSVEDGIFDVILGAAAPPNLSVPLTIAFDRELWLEISVDGTTLPRTRLTAVPYSLNAKAVSGAADLTSLRLATGAADGYVLTTDADGNASWQVAAAGSGWGLNGNTLSGGEFIGSLNQQPLELRVAGKHGLRLETIPNSALATPSIVGGHESNAVTNNAHTVTISGGGAPNKPNLVSASNGTIGGGVDNSVSGLNGTVAGGADNSAEATHAVVAGGNRNAATSSAASVVGGISNTASGSGASIGGGNYNTASGVGSTVPGGTRNVAAGLLSLAAGHGAQAQHEGTFVWADNALADQVINEFPSTADNQFLVRAEGGVGIGKNDPQSQLDVDGTVTMTGFRLNSGTPGNGDVLTFNSTTGEGEWQAGGAGGGWGLGGNAGTDPSTDFIGTSDNQPLEVKVNGQRVLRLEPGANPNVLAGSFINTLDAGVAGATISGGGGGPGGTHRIHDRFGVIGGGQGNTVGDVGSVSDSQYGTVSGGSGNRATAEATTVGGGRDNQATGRNGVVAGGAANVASAQMSAVVGGSNNTASGDFATVAGGGLNTASGLYSFAAGRRAQAVTAASFVWADNTNADFASTSAKQFLIRAGGGVGIGKNDPQSQLDVAGTVTMTGIKLNSGTPSDGDVLTFSATTGEGEWQAGGAGGGWGLGGNAGTDPTTDFIGTSDNQPLEVKVNGQRVLRLEPGANPNVVAGSFVNTLDTGVTGATISGGGGGPGGTHRIHDRFGVIGGGQGNTVGDPGSVSDSQYGTVSGGSGNRATAEATTVGGGRDNQATGRNGVVAGGTLNVASAQMSAVVGGSNNTASGDFATVAGGGSNTASGLFSFAAGRRAQAVTAASFVWADNTNADFASTAAKQFLIRAGGGVGIGKNDPQSQLDVNGTVTMTGIKLNSGTPTDGDVLTFNATTGEGEWQAGGAGGGWGLGGNAGTDPSTDFIGTSDNQPLEVKVNGQRVLRLEPGANPNVVAGSFVNTLDAGVTGATISGGGGGPGGTHRIHDRFGVIGGGQGNIVGDVGSVSDSQYGTVSGGSGNRATAEAATVGGGRDNQATGRNGVVVGGTLNVASAQMSAIVGGSNNTASGDFATVAGGTLNDATALNSFAAGRRAKAVNAGTFVWADDENVDFSSTAARQFLIRAGGGVGIGKNDPQSQLDVAGTVTMTGIKLNSGTPTDGDVLSYNATTGEGEWKELPTSTNNGAWSLSGNSGVDPTTQYIGTSDATELRLLVDGSHGFRLMPGGSTVNIVGGSTHNEINSAAEGITISGGGQPPDILGNSNANKAFAPYVTVSGGSANEIVDINASWATISGGKGNEIAGAISTIGGGQDNKMPFSTGATIAGGGNNSIIANGHWASISGGNGNSAGELGSVGGGSGNGASGLYSVIGGGKGNVSSAESATVSGGDSNLASATGAAIPGGVGNRATGSFALAAGRSADAAHSGSFVWSDSTPDPFSSTDQDQFLVKASRGVGINKNNPQSALDVQGKTRTNQIQILNGAGQGLVLTSDSNGNGSWLVPKPPLLKIGSDREKKTGFQPVDQAEVLRKLVSLNIEKWEYKEGEPGSGARHIGPMAQDFHRAFKVGADEKYIDVVDGVGVSFAAIQALYRLVLEKEATIAAQAKEIEELKAAQASVNDRVAAIESALRRMEPGRAVSLTSN